MYWTTKKDTRIALSDMSTEHLIHAVNRMRRQAARAARFIEPMEAELARRRTQPPCAKCGSPDASYDPISEEPRCTTCSPIVRPQTKRIAGATLTLVEQDVPPLEPGIVFVLETRDSDRYETYYRMSANIWKALPSTTLVDAALATSTEMATLSPEEFAVLQLLLSEETSEGSIVDVDDDDDDSST